MRLLEAAATLVDLDIGLIWGNQCLPIRLPTRNFYQEPGVPPPTWICCCRSTSISFSTRSSSSVMSARVVVIPIFLVMRTGRRTTRGTRFVFRDARFLARAKAWRRSGEAIVFVLTVLLRANLSRTLETMEVPFTPEQEAQLAQMAAMAGTNPERFVRDILVRYIEDEARFFAAVERGIEAAERGEFIEEEEMDARVEHMFKR